MQKYIKESSNNFSDINRILIRYGFQIIDNFLNKYAIFRYKNSSIVLYDSRVDIAKENLNIRDVALDLAGSLVQTIRNTRDYKNVPLMFQVLDQIIKDFNFNPRMTELIDGMREEE